MEQKIEEILEEVRALKPLTNEVEEVKRLVSETNAQLGPVNKRLDDLEAMVREMKREMAELRGEMAEMGKENEYLRRENWVNKTRLDFGDQYSRKSNLIIRGIPWEENEDLEEIVQQLAVALKVPLNDTNIVAVHRLPREEGIPPIIIRFVKYKTRDIWIEASKREKLESEAIGVLPSTSIFCDEHLSAKNRRLLGAALALKSSKKIKHVWHRNGMVKVREDDNTPVIWVQDESQLERWYEEAEYEEHGQTQSQPATAASNNGPAPQNLPNQSKPPAKPPTTKKKTMGQSSIRSFTYQMSNVNPRGVKSRLQYVSNLNRNGGGEGKGGGRGARPKT